VYAAIPEKTVAKARGCGFSGRIEDGQWRTGFGFFALLGPVECEFAGEDEKAIAEC